MAITSTKSASIGIALRPGGIVKPLKLCFSVILF